ncbi:hypothetical protein [Phenylobacterium sp.]|uniref:hypothetical protein n=1 Tax=Phenylobacterium sp. TaxID=1871053 RepID=UPI0027308865|nr:hypothetical protein [Phenylobacterium sp.]MDP1599009.1 hypothetical protein [Phenylobacterium sp.]MDP3590437.1 hypothetical protein [Phenylobacterium sp.]
MRLFLANHAEGEQVRVNIRAVANTAAIRREKRGDRDVIIVPSATLPDNVVMNGILYPAAEIEKSFKGLERTPAPLGHPTINGKFVSARDPEGINLTYIGAWNENVRRENGRVLLDKVIDVEVANRTEGGKAVLAAIDKGGPIHTSTGLLARMEPVANATTHTRIARGYVFDHDAILLDEKGAATPEAGVGMMVNAAGDEEEIEVVNSVIEDDAERDLGWALDSALKALEKRQRAPLLERAKAALIEVFTGSEREPSNNQKDDDMDKVQFDELSARVNTLSEAVKPEALAAAMATAVGNAVAAAMKPLVDAQEAVANSLKAKDDAELTDLVGKIVKANIMDEDAAKELTLNAARALAKKAEPGKAAPLTNAFNGPGGDKPAYTLPKAEA